MKAYYKRGGITIYHGDSRDVAPTLGPADLVVTSPPYANQRRYGFKNGTFNWHQVVPTVLSAVRLAPQGQMLVNLGLVHDKGEVHCYWTPLIPTLQSFGYRFFGWYVWDQGAGMAGDWNGRFAPSFEFVFHFNRAARQPTKFVPCKTAGERRGLKRAPRGTDGVARIFTHSGRPVQPFKIPDSTIRVNRECRHTEHPAVFPPEFAEHLIQAYPGVVLDPFMGAGSTLIAAQTLGRPAVGIEIDERYCEIAAERLEQAKDRAA